MVLVTSLDDKSKIWRGPTLEKCGRNSVYIYLAKYNSSPCIGTPPLHPTPPP